MAVLQMSIDIIKKKWSHTKKARRKWYPEETITYADNTDDLALLANTLAQAKILLHSLHQETLVST